MLPFSFLHIAKEIIVVNYKSPIIFVPIFYEIILMALIKKLYQTIIYYLRTKLSRVQFIMVIATLVGLVSGLVAVLLKTLVHYVQHWIATISLSRYAYLLFPVIGLLLCVFIIRMFFNGRSF